MGGRFYGDGFLSNNKKKCMDGWEVGWMGLFKPSSSSSSSMEERYGTLSCVGS